MFPPRLTDATLPASHARAAPPVVKLAQRSIGKAVRHEGPPSVARVYADVNVRQPTDYSDYEALSITWGEQDDYEVVRKVGRGKYSEVFEGRTVSTGAKCIIKVRRSCLLACCAAACCAACLTRTCMLLIRS